MKLSTVLVASLGLFVTACGAAPAATTPQAKPLQNISELAGVWTGVDVKNRTTVIMINPDGRYHVDVSPGTADACVYDGTFDLTNEGNGRYGLHYSFDVNTCNPKFVGNAATDYINTFSGNAMVLDEDGSGDLMPMKRTAMTASFPDVPRIVRSIDDLAGTWTGVDENDGKTVIKIERGGRYHVDYRPGTDRACEYSGQFTLTDDEDGTGRKGLQYQFDVNTCNPDYVGKTSTDYINSFGGNAMELDEDGSGQLMPMTRN